MRWLGFKADFKWRAWLGHLDSRFRGNDGVSVNDEKRGDNANERKPTTQRQRKGEEKKGKWWAVLDLNR